MADNIESTSFATVVFAVEFVLRCAWVMSTGMHASNRSSFLIKEVVGQGNYGFFISLLQSSEADL